MTTASIATTVQSDGPVKVPNADDMPDSNFLQHMDRRHAREGFAHYSKHITEQQVELWRKYHDRLHEIALPGQHDHVHLD